jgi:site-specific DNA-methyltransferase (adenine-specific)
MNVQFEIVEGDSEQILSSYENEFFDSCITDPPYGMGMEHWDHSVPKTSLWKEVYRTLKPGSFCLAFCSPQLYHRLACNIEDAGFKIVDQIMWMTTTKMPKTNRLKPAHEPIVVAQKPFVGKIEDNFIKYGVGKIDVESARVPWDKEPPKGWVAQGAKRLKFGKKEGTTGGREEFGTVDANPNGRYPSNIVGEVLEDHQKYFYAPRVTRKERGEYNTHPTPKPISLMEYLIKIYCPEGKKVLDPFNGSGSSGIAAIKNNRIFYGIDLSKEYCDIAKKRIDDFLREKQ